MKDIKALVNGILDAAIPPEKKDIPPLFRSWRDVAGDDCAAHSRIIDYAEGILVIEVDHPGWIQIIMTRRKRILSALKRKFPAQRIESVRLILGGGGAGTARGEEKPASTRSGVAPLAPPLVSPAGANLSGSRPAKPLPPADAADRSRFTDLLKRLGREIEERAEGTEKDSD